MVKHYLLNLFLSLIWFSSLFLFFPIIFPLRLHNLIYKILETFVLYNLFVYLCIYLYYDIFIWPMTLSISCVLSKRTVLLLHPRCLMRALVWFAHSLLSICLVSWKFKKMFFNLSFCTYSFVWYEFYKCI